MAMWPAVTHASGVRVLGGRISSGARCWKAGILQG